MAHALVLGATGFLGKACLRVIDHDAFEVTSPSRDELDLLDAESVKCFFKSQSKIFDFVLNFAANVGSVHYVSRLPATVISENLQISLNIYNALVNADMLKCRVVNPISNCCYPASSGKNIEGKMDFGPLHESVQSYGAYKRALLAISECYFRQFGLRSMNIMFPGIFGPGDSINPDHAHALNGMIVRAIESYESRDKYFEIWGTGKPIRDWLFVDDAIAAIFFMLTQDDAKISFPINVTSQNHISISDLAKTILNILKSDAVITYNNDYADGVLEKVLIPGKFKNLNPNFPFTPFHDAISETVTYLRGVLNAKRI